MADRKIKCRNCNQDFEFTEGEQKFFEQKGFTEPTRCKPCREQFKQQQQGGRPNNNRR